MAFTFGQSQPAASTAFSFGQPAAGTTTAFGQTAGQTSSLFGQPAAGTSAFGQPTAAGTSAFGQPAAAGTSAFGQPAASTTLNFGGSSFGQPATGSAFSFGQTATSQPSGGLFGQPAASTAPSLFGSTGGFGTTSSAPTTSFSFGQPQTSTSSGFGGFGSTFGTATTSAPSFSLGQPSATTFSGFGAAPATTSSAFSFGNTTTLPQFTGFGSNTGSTFGNTGGMFGQQQQQQQQQLLQQQQAGQPQIDEQQAFHNSIYNVHKFGDERDSVLAKMNFLMAAWGCGKGHYSQTFPPVTYTPSNPHYRFKAVGYAYIFTDTNEDGNIMLTIKKPQSQVEAAESSIIQALQNMVSRPHIMFKVTGVKAMGEDVTQLVFHAEDKNSLRRVPATEMATFFTQPQYKPQFDSMGVEKVVAKVKPSPEQMKKYLDSPPEGIDPRVWKAAQDDNPDPNIMIPVPILGLEALKNRIEGQKSETRQHHERQNLMLEQLTQLQQRHTNMNAEIAQLRRKHAEQAHRILAIICRQEMTRKQGLTIQPEEEQLKEQLEKLHEEFNSPTRFKGRLNELLSQIRLRKAENEHRGGAARYSIDTASLSHMNEFLTMEQDSLNHLVNTLRQDLETGAELKNSAIEMIRSKKLAR